MKYKIKLELLQPGKTEPVAAEEENLDGESLRLLAESLQGKISGSGSEAPLNQALERLSSIAPEWTSDFLNSI